jgi:DnaJ-class molecular chaperone
VNTTTKTCPNCKGRGNYTVREIRNQGQGKHEVFYDTCCEDCDGEGVVPVHDLFCANMKDPGRACDCGAEEELAESVETHKERVTAGPTSATLTGGEIASPSRAIPVAGFSGDSRQS